MKTNLTRRQFMKQTGTAATSIVMLNLFSACGSDKQKPNIIFYIADDMRPEMFNCLPEGRGKNLTPNIDRLAGEGTIMMDQHVSSPVCTPSRYSCLTGRYASRATNEAFITFTKKQEGQTVIQWNSFITENDETLPRLLQQSGYKTGMVGKNHVVEVKDLYQFPSYDLDPKAPEVKQKLEENSEKIKSAIHNIGFDHVSHVYHNNPNFIGLKELAVQNLDWITQGGVEFIDQAKDQPFFLYFATTVPHYPNEPERSWNANPLISADGYLDEPPDVMPPRQTISERIKKAGLEGNDKENVLWVDDSLGALIKKLEEHQLMDNTIIFFFNDHGQNAKGTIYQGGVHNPSIVWKKDGFPCGSICETQVSNVDFAPTILDMAGSNTSTVKFDGRSFYPALNGQKQQIHDVLYFELGFVRGVRKGDWKYIALRYPEYAKNMTLDERQRVLEQYNERRRFRNMVIINTDPAKPFSHLEVLPGGGHAEFESTGKYTGYYDADQLYDVSVDPGEQNNLADDPEYQNKLQEMKLELQKVLDTLPGKFDL
ncbi:sulfatase [bacterium]